MAKKSTPSNNGKKTASGPEGKTLKIEFGFPSGDSSSFSNYMTVQHRDDGIFHLAFFEIIHPLLLGDEDAIQEQMQALESVPASCVGKLVMSSAQMKRVIAALADSYDRYEAELRKTEAASPKPTKGKKKNAG